MYINTGEERDLKHNGPQVVEHGDWPSIATNGQVANTLPTANHRRRDVVSDDSAVLSRSELRSELICNKSRSPSSPFSLIEGFRGIPKHSLVGRVC